VCLLASCLVSSPVDNTARTQRTVAPHQTSSRNHGRVSIFSGETIMTLIVTHGGSVRHPHYCGLFLTLFTIISPPLGCSKIAEPIPIQGTATSTTRSTGPTTNFLQLKPQPLTLGRQTRSTIGVRHFEVQNVTKETITLASISTSCSCISATNLPLKLESNQKTSLTLQFNPKDEPDFVGRLAVDLVGRRPDGSIVFRESLAVQVE